MKFMCIRNELQPTYAVRDCCRVLMVSTSGYYRWENAPPSARSLRRCSRHWISPDNSKRQTRDFKILPIFQIACVTVAAVGLIALDFPTFSGHTIILTNSPGRLELFGAERTNETA